MRVLFLVLALVSRTVLSAQEPALIDLSDSTGASGLQALDSVNGRFFLASEIHGVSANARQWQLLALHLHDRKGVRNIAIERSPSVAYLFNRYLETGDTGFLTRSAVYEEERQAIEALRRHCGNAPMRIFGIDAERFFGALIATLNDLADKSNLAERDPALRQQLRALSATLRPGEKDILAVIKSFRQAAADPGFQLPGAASTALGPILENPAFSNGKFRMVLGEQEKFELLLRQLPDTLQGGFFAQFGIFHTELDTRSSLLYKERLATQLNERKESPFRAAVVTIGVHYLDCRGEYRDDIRVIPDEGVLDRADAKRLRALSAPGSYLLLPAPGRYSYKAVIVHAGYGPHVRLPWWRR